MFGLKLNDDIRTPFGFAWRRLDPCDDIRPMQLPLIEGGFNSSNMRVFLSKYRNRFQYTTSNLIFDDPSFVCINITDRPIGLQQIVCDILPLS